MANEVKLTYIAGLSGVTANVFSANGADQRNSASAVSLSDTGHAGLYLGDCTDIQVGDIIIYYLNDVYLGGTTYEIAAGTVTAGTAGVIDLDICNMALSRFGEKSVTAAQITANEDPNAVQCNRHYEQTRDALLRSFWWRFAGARIRLASAWADDTVYTTDQYVSYSSVWYKCASAHTSVTGGGDNGGGEPDTNTTQWTAKTDADMVPDVEWDLVFDLPADFLANRYTYDDNDAHRSLYSYKVEGNKYYTRESAVDYVYTKQVTTVTEFDPLFIEVLVLSLAVKMVLPISQDDDLYRDLKEELYGSRGRSGLMSKVRVMDRQEQNTKGLYDYNTWLAAFRTSRDPTKYGGA